jgi:hypothetical protein
MAFQSFLGLILQGQCHTLQFGDKLLIKEQLLQTI